MRMVTNDELDAADKEFYGKVESTDIVDFKHYTAKVKERIANGVSHNGEKLPWSKSFDLVRLRPGEVSIWAGVNGHGKSLLLGQIMLWLPPTQKVLIASLEMPGEATIARMCQQTLTTGVPSDKYIDWFMEESNNFYLYDVTGTVPAKRILPLVYYASKVMGINHIVLDSLVKFGIRHDDLTGQKDFVNELCAIAKDFGSHIHLVHHMKKGEKESQEPDKWDIKGAGEITDLADNVFMHQRHKDKEKKIDDGEEVNELAPDASLHCAKQRHGEWEGKIALYFDKLSGQFMSHPNSRLKWKQDIPDTHYPQAGNF